MSSLEEFKTYREKIKKCKLCGEDVTKDKPVPPYLHAVKAKVVIFMMTPEAEDHKRRQPVPFSGVVGEFVKAALLDAGLAKKVETETKSGKVKKEIKIDWEIGFSTICKCKPSKGSLNRRVAKACFEEYFESDIEFNNINTVIVIGEKSAKFLLPDLYASLKGGYLSSYSLYNQVYDQDGIRYLILMDPLDIMPTRTVDIRDLKNNGDYMMFVAGLEKIKGLI